jgi:hypothetical protein
MSTTPPGIRRVSFRAALALGAAFTAAAFGAGFTLAADESGNGPGPDNIRVEHSVGYRDGARPDVGATVEGRAVTSSGPLPEVCEGASAAMGNYNVLREDAISLRCRFHEQNKGSAETAVRELRGAAKILEDGHR